MKEWRKKVEDEKRKAGSYEIIQAFHIRDPEIVIGEDINAKPEERYMCAYCQQNEIAALYNAVMVSDDYCEIVKLFADRLSEQAEKTRTELSEPKLRGIDVTPLTNKDCTPVSYDDDLHGKIVVIRPGAAERVSAGNPSAEALHWRLWSQPPQPGFRLFLCRFVFR